MNYTAKDVRHEDNGSHGRYVIDLGDGAEAEMTYRKLSASTIAIDHTLVPNSHRGGGIAMALVQRGIDDARASGTKIMPICSYVVAQFRRHPEWTDLRA